MKRGTRLYRASVLGTAVLGIGMLTFGSVALAQTVLGTGNHNYSCRAGDAMTLTSINSNEAGIDCATTTTGSTTTTQPTTTSTTVASTTTSTVASTTTTQPTTTTTGSGTAPVFIQADDTGTFNGNTTSICSGCVNQVLKNDTGIGHTVILVIQTLSGSQTDTVSSITTAMGTFHFVNSYNDGADNEIWVCNDTTGSSDSIAVNTSTNAWDAFAIEFSQPATGVVNGGGQVANLGYLAKQSWTVSPGAAGNIALVAVDTADAYETGSGDYPAAPWSSYNHGYWSASNGTSVAWQVTSSSSPVTATWVQDGGVVSSQGVVVQY